MSESDANLQVAGLRQSPPGGPEIQRVLDDPFVTGSKRANGVIVIGYLWRSEEITSCVLGDPLAELINAIS